MPGAIFGRVADIEQIERAPVGLVLPLRQGGAVDDRDAIAPGDRLGPLPRLCEALGRDRGRSSGGAR